MTDPIPQTTVGRKKPRPLPMPEAGQLWHTTAPRSGDRRVLKVEHWKHGTKVVVDGIGLMSLGQFHAWARRVYARPYSGLSV